MVMILKNGMYLSSNLEENETYEDIYNRLWFIISHTSINNNIDNLVKLSKLWINCKKYNCKYNSNIMNQISQVEKNMYSDKVF